MRSCGMLAVLVIGGCAAVACGADAPAGDAAEPPQRISTLQAIILGIVEGLTEYLPVSSTGHLILANDALGLSRFIDPAHPLRSGVEKVPGVDAYDIVIQLGAILAVLGLYRKRVGQMARGLAGRDPQGLALVAALAVAFLPAAVVGVLAHKWIKATLFNPLSVVAALAVGGALMIVVEHYFWRRRPVRAGVLARKDEQRITDVAQVRLWQALVIGLAQCLAMWPGTSRSMITILAALVIGLDMLAAAEFSFLLALPTLGAATLYEGYKSWHELSQSAGVEAMAIGLVVSALVAALAVKGFVRWLTRHGLLPFGIYRLALAAVVFAYFAL